MGGLNADYNVFFQLNKTHNNHSIKNGPES